MIKKDCRGNFFEKKVSPAPLPNAFIRKAF
jgi:hypothetical protein